MAVFASGDRSRNLFEAHMAGDIFENDLAAIAPRFRCLVDSLVVLPAKPRNHHRLVIVRMVTIGFRIATNLAFATFNQSTIDCRPQAGMRPDCFRVP